MIASGTSRLQSLETGCRLSDVCLWLTVTYAAAAFGAAVVFLSWSSGGRAGSSHPL